MIPDQTAIWDKKHDQGDHAGLRGTPSPLCLLTEPMFPRHARILELGCGVGRDAVHLASKGHSMLTTDSSGVVIRQNKSFISDSNITFEMLDIQQPLPYSEKFDVVFANLSLHYFTHEKTRDIIQNIATILKPNGLLAFACKSKDDIRTKDARTVEKDVFVAPNGHAMHRFSIPYTKRLLNGVFEIEYLDEVEEEYQGRRSSIVRCMAKVKK